MNRAMRIKPRVRRCSGILAVGWSAVVLVLTLAAIPSATGADRPQPGDDWTFRPTVIIRKGSSQGSGSVIGSVRDETLVLTAAHVVEEPGALKVEFHRYNLGLEREPAGKNWPRSVTAEVVAADVAADVAILRIKGLAPLPYVARLAVHGAEPPRGTVVTSIGIDLGTHLSSWTSRIAGIDRFEIEGTGGERLFLITTKPPEHGRSGGGLFLANGDLVGVCVGRAQLIRGKKNSGVFASSTSIRRLLRTHGLEARVGPAASDSTSRAASASTHQRSAITTTRARPGR